MFFFLFSASFFMYNCELFGFVVGINITKNSFCKH